MTQLTPRDSAAPRGAPRTPAAPPPVLSGASANLDGAPVLKTVLAVALLLAGIGAVSSTSLALDTIRAADEERDTATATMQSLLGEVQAISFESLVHGRGWGAAVCSALEAGAVSDAALAAGALEPWEGSDTVCSIEIIRDETLTDAQLGCDLGMPRDLNNDGRIDSKNVTESARLLPVIVRARWRGASGNRELARGSYLMGH